MAWFIALGRSVASRPIGSPNLPPSYEPFSPPSGDQLYGFGFTAGGY